MDSKKCKYCGKPYVERELALPMMQEKDRNGNTKKRTVTVADCNCETIEWERKRFEEEVEKNLKDSNLPEKYKNEDMKDWVKVTGTEEMTDAIKRYLNNAEENLSKGQGMIIAGPVGTGKTKIQTYLLRKLMIDYGISAYFISSDGLGKKLSMFKDSARELDEFVEKLSNRKIVMFDDLAESTIPEWRMKHFTYIINQRYYNQKVTFFNTMKTIEEVKSVLGEHIMSRLFEMCDGYIVEIKSKVDMREPKNRERFIKNPVGELL